MRIEDYGLIGDLQTAALVSRAGSIDWLCVPRFDSAACFAALLGEPRHGRWLLAPAGEPVCSSRRYRPDTLVLETDFEGEEGAVRVIDFMPPRTEHPVVIRIVEGLRGQVAMRTELVIRFGYGRIVPWVRRVDDARMAIAGPDALRIDSPVDLRGVKMTSVAEFRVSEGDRVPFALTWFPSHLPPPDPIHPEEALTRTETFWRQWADRCTHTGEWHDDVHRSLLVLKALTYAPTGGIVAAPTTSLPEWIASVRNWDYRYCWLRDATLTLVGFLDSGYLEEARAWRGWLLRAVAGDPSDLQIMYGAAGERWLAEYEADWLPGFEDSRPVRVGNAASDQLQLDVYGEVIDAFYNARSHGLEASEDGWSLSRKLLEFLETGWREPDAGIWEVRGPYRHFTHSKVMAWVAFDRAVRTVERWGNEGPVERWREIRDEIHADVCEHGFDPHMGAFTQSYGSPRLDASVLAIPLVGFLPAVDDRVRSTVEVIGRELNQDGLIVRYQADEQNTDVDGLPPGEGVFLPCSFWYAADLALLGRVDEARDLYARLLALRNDLGLLSEEYDPVACRMLGNFPQAFTHLTIVGCAHVLVRGESPREAGAPS